MDKYLSKYILSSLKFVSPERKCHMPLKRIYEDYKIFMLVNQLEPLNYKNFRDELKLILDATKNSHNEPESIDIKMYRTRWEIYNVQIISKATPDDYATALYSTI
uniref:Uncharacterized protein n=1 Tax=Halimeda discoidea TaxID=118222 RepID=A0A1C9JB76_9CHLO|nr:hypothetical protein [Halimeda discoidea]